ncbi:MAG: hypothetical protein CM15mP109_11050 [Candidatus Dadabacteria bacterium]|nr:MAG: hypothetical protein CM15mP109_11050 [Candidatus Dadabacteria bacterium]
MLKIEASVLPKENCLCKKGQKAKIPLLLMIWQFMVNLRELLPKIASNTTSTQDGPPIIQQ